MPLILCVIFFIVLFSFEGFWHLAEKTEQAQQLRRYQAIEHRHRRTSDDYLNWL